MYNVPNRFITNIAKYGRQFDNQILINGVTEPISIYDINIFKHRFNASLFQSVMRVIEVDSNEKINKGSTITGKIGIKYNENSYDYINYNNYKVIEEPEYDEDTRAYISLAYDKMHEAMIDYDLEPTFPIKVRNFLILICNRLGWNTSHIPTSFINSETLILDNVFKDINYTFRNVLDEIAKITCSFPCFDLEGFFTLKYITETNKTIDNSYLKEDNLTFDKEYFINSVVFVRGEGDIYYRKDTQDIETNGLHEYRLSDLQILSMDNRTDYMNAMYTYLRTLRFWIFDIQSTGVFIFDIADRFTIETDDNTYSVVALNIEGTVEQGLSEQMYLEEPEETETDYKYATADEKIDNITKIMVDKQNKKITQLTSKVTENTSKIAQQEIEIDRISQKVEDVENLTNTVSGTKTIALANCIAGNLLNLNIYGNNSVFDILYASDDIYASDDLYAKGDSRIIVTDKDGEQTLYELGVEEVLRQNGDVYDEYVLENGQAKVIRRINQDGSIKETEEIENLGTFTIELEEGTNTITIKNYTARLQARYALKSTYTDQFATKIEMRAEINTTAQGIEAEVARKLDEDEFSTKLSLDYQSVQIAWNTISEFIKFINGELQIKDTNNNLLMSLNKTGQHFYNTNSAQIGSIGLIGGATQDISFSINGIDGTNRMVWGVKYNDNFIPVFYFTGYNKEIGTEVGGKFVFTAPVFLEGQVMYLGGSENSPCITGQEIPYLNNGNIVKEQRIDFDNVDQLGIYDSNNNLLLEMLENQGGSKTFNFQENNMNAKKIYATEECRSPQGFFDNIPTSNTIHDFSNTGYDYLIATLKSSAGGGSIYCQGSQSDRKLKKDIKNTEIKALDIIKQIKHRQYNWKINNKHETIGYIAQELEKINPYLVNKIEKTYVLNEKAILATTTKAIQEMQEEMDSLKNEINKLKGDKNGEN